MNKELYKIAKSYCNTPHINGGNIKGVGLDCCTLITHILSDYYGLQIDVDFGYSGDWFCERDCKEIMLPYLERYFVRVSHLRPGDIISYTWGRAHYAHLSMYLGNNLVVHCMADIGVEITEITDPCFSVGNRDRISGVWRVRDELIQKTINNKSC